MAGASSARMSGGAAHEDRRPQRDQEPGAPRRHRPGRRTRPLEPRAPGVRAAGSRPRERGHRRGLCLGGSEHLARRGRRLRGRRHDHEGQRAAPGRVRSPARRPSAVHVPAPGSGPRLDGRPAGPQGGRHRLRDDPARRRNAAPAHAHERSGRAAVGAGGRALPGEPHRGTRPAPRGRPRHPSRQGGRHRWRERRAERGQDGHGHGRPGLHPRRQPRPPALPGRHLPRAGADDGEFGVRHPRGDRRRRPGHRGRAGDRVPALRA